MEGLLRTILCVAALVLITGCSSLSDAQGDCSAANSSYSGTWSCIRERVASGQAGAMNNDIGVRYLAYGDALDERVKAGEISDTEAKLLLADALSAGVREYEDRRSSGATVSIGEGLRSYGESLQRSNPRPITCQTIGNVTRCY